ncbi:hypothetical protein [Thiomicrospira sp. WB1]|uniref:hypothetical protein n=1 Tax=Thiomicrospira sp. WB1 TaxID=1685380 RepID=UPI0007484900|nr:hypothetical protein [Thiomicrospira sp. WB1]KUJ73010.1 hypothetical protein AVO41_04400 [Thiomicrospira sp. WB1]
MIHVVCLKWGNKYSQEDVHRLHHMVNANMSLPHAFYCITDDPDGLDEAIHPLPIFDTDLEGWWHKLSLFRKDFYGLQGTVLFLDLDVVITGSLDGIINYQPEKVIACQDYGKCKWSQLNSSVLRFEVGQIDFVWQSFLFNKRWILEYMHGDQDWLGHVAPQIETFPREWVVSFKRHCDAEAKNTLGMGHRWIERGWIKPKGEAKLPKETKIVLFHGKPDPIDVVNGPYKRWRKAPWILNYWP